MKIELEINKDIHFNANKYLEKAKKLKQKIPGIEKIIQKTRDEIIKFEEKKKKFQKEKKKEKNLKKLKQKTGLISLDLLKHLMIFYLLLVKMQHLTKF